VGGADFKVFSNISSNRIMHGTFRRGNISFHLVAGPSDCQYCYKEEKAENSEMWKQIWRRKFAHVNSEIQTN
jgi:hypothetical protein